MISDSSDEAVEPPDGAQPPLASGFGNGCRIVIDSFGILSVQVCGGRSLTSALCQRDTGAPPVSCADFNSDSLPSVPAFREARTMKVNGGITRMDAKPAPLALGVQNVA